eukprot:scaffold49078_cov18-Tisochrysis_lutea.AAC.1
MRRQVASIVVVVCPLTVATSNWNRSVKWCPANGYRCSPLLKLFLCLLSCQRKVRMCAQRIVGRRECCNRLDAAVPWNPLTKDRARVFFLVCSEGMWSAPVGFTDQ